MTTAAIVDIYDAVKRSNGEYCSICFHTSDVRKLVNPVFIKQLMVSMKDYKIPYNLKNKKDVKVCYVCEALAERSVRFMRVVSLAASVEAMITWMTDGLRDSLIQHRDFPHLHQTDQTKRVVKRATNIETAMREAGAPSLACSQVLVVGSDTPATSGRGASAATATGASGAGGANSANTAGGETIVIDDEVSHRGRHSDVIIRPEQMTMQIRDRGSENFVLHPMVVGTDGKIYVPSLKVELLNNEILKSVSDQDLLKYTNTPIPPKPAKPVKRKPIENDFTKVNKTTSNRMIDDYYEFIKQQAEHKKGITNPPDTSTNKEINELEKAVESITNKKTRFDSSDMTAVNGTEEIQDGGSGTDGAELKSVKVYGNKGSTKRPVLIMDKVLDWEDKIPMDIISFMDATDPNPSERIMQPNAPPFLPPMGIISDVRSIEDNDVLLVENIECIDLC